MIQMLPVIVRVLEVYVDGPVIQCLANLWIFFGLAVGVKMDFPRKGAQAPKDYADS